MAQTEGGSSRPSGYRDPVGTLGDDPPTPPRSRLGSFVARYRWRAYAVPILAVATFVSLLDAARVDSSANSTSARSDTVITSTAAGARTNAAVDPAAGAPTTAPPGPRPAPTGSTAGSRPAPTTVVRQGRGTLGIVPGQSDVRGTGGSLLRFRVEIEDGIGVDGQAFAAAVTDILGDPRSWGADGRRSFQRVSSGSYDFQVALVSPDNVDSFCPGVDTGGYTSCRSGDRATINLARWETAVPEYGGDVTTYRQYVINHEVGHVLGNGHQLCPGPGQPAPVMQQQTLGLDGCRKNSWPYPKG